MTQFIAIAIAIAALIYFVREDAVRDIKAELKTATEKLVAAETENKARIEAAGEAERVDDETYVTGLERRLEEAQRKISQLSPEDTCSISAETIDAINSSR